MFEDPTQAAWGQPAWVCGERTALHACQPAEMPTQTTERVEKAFMTLQSIERCACDQQTCQLCKSVDADEQRGSRMPWIMISGWSHPW